MTLRNHTTMRDLISKLDAIINETALKDPADLDAKRKALDDLEADPVASKDPEISSAIDQRRADLEKEAKAKGFSESFEIGDDFGISFSEDFEIATEITDILEDGIVIDLDDAALDMLTKEGLVFLDGELSEGRGSCWVGYEQKGMKKKGNRMVPNCVKEDHGPEDPDAEYNQGEYDREGDMAKDDLRTIADAAQELYSILDADENLPEWVQLKIIKAVDYLDTARDYMKANKYAEDQDMEESGLQYYTGKKKYGKEGMAALAAAGRDGASEEELGKIKDKYKKEDADVDEAKYHGKEVPLGKKLPGDVKKSKVYVRKPNGKIVKVNFGDKKMRIKKSNPKRRKSFRARHNCKNPGPRWKARYWSCRSW